MKKMNCKLNTKLIVLSLVIMLMFSFAICSISSADIAYAQLPDTYLDANQETGTSDYDWYFAEGYENLFRLKELIKDTVGINWTYLEAHPVVIAVIDTGIDVDHRLFTGAYNENGASITLDPEDISPYDVLYRDENGEVIGKNVASSQNHDATYDLSDTAADCHGTHVSGILAVLIHFLELEKYIKIMPVKASYPDSGKNYYSATTIFDNSTGALAYATYNKADVINMSFASDKASSFNNSSLATYASSAVLVASASNNGDKKNYYPAANPNVIGVMNSTYTDGHQTVYSGSTRGEQYDLAAPGYKIMSSITSNFNQTKYNEDGDLYGELTGTSMSTPMVSFAAALLTMKYRGLAANEENEPTPTAIREFTKYTTYTNTVDDIKISYLEMDKLFEIDFLDDSSGEYVIAPEAITISGTDLRQSLESRHEITLTASISPVEYQYAPNLKWYAYDPEDTDRNGDTLLGTGKTIKYTPDNRKGYTNIYAVLTYNNGANNVQSNELAFTMEYYTLTASKVTLFLDSDIPTGEVEAKTGDTINLSIKDYQYTDPDHRPIVLWYVNGVVVNEGPTLNYNTQDAGKYEIFVTVNSAKSDFSVMLNVAQGPSDEKMPMWQIWLISTAIVIALAGSVILTVYLIKKSKK